MQSLFNKKIILPIIALGILAIIVSAIVNFFSQLSNEQQAIKKLNADTPVTEEVTEVKSADITHSEAEDSSTPIVLDDQTIKPKESNLFDIEAAKKLKEEVKPVVVVEKKVEPKEEPKEEEVKLKPVNLNGKFPFIKFSQAPSDMYSILKDAPENNNEELLPSRFKNAIEAGKENIFIHAIDGDTWISYQSDNDDIKRFVLQKGRHVLIKGDVILLFMGNINVTRIFYNNQLLKIDSKTGVKSLIFPESEAPNQELPLFPAYKGVPYKASVYKENMAEN